MIRHFRFAIAAIFLTAFPALLAAQALSSNGAQES